MHWLGRFLGFLLALCLVATAQLWILEQTISNADYLISQMHETHFADQLAGVLPEVAAQIIGESEETRLAIKEAVTPKYVESQLDALVPQMIGYLHGNGPQPVLDLRDLEAPITNAGLPIPAKLQSMIDTPSNVNAGQFDSILIQVATRSTQLLWLVPLVGLILLVLIVILLGHRRWSVLAGSAVFAALVLGVIGLVDYSPPRLISSAIETSPVKALAPALLPFTTSIAKNQTQAAWIVAATLIGVSVILIFMGFVAKIISQHRKKRKLALHKNSA
jgi:hypothetical protein